MSHNNEYNTFVDKCESVGIEGVACEAGDGGDVGVFFAIVPFLAVLGTPETFAARTVEGLGGVDAVGVGTAEATQGTLVA